MKPKIVTAVLDENSGCEAVYINGEKVTESETIYMGELAKVLPDETPIVFRHMSVELPTDENLVFPAKLEDLPTKYPLFG